MVKDSVKLLAATNNQHKLTELRALLTISGVELLSPVDVGVAIDFDVAETGQTFAENATIKAIAYSQQTGLQTLADDSGLMVEALSGQPGIHSKRWIKGTDHDRNLHLLNKLKEKDNRKAQFVSVLALHDPILDQTLLFEGIVRGSIAMRERGTHGFGYDPLFIPDGSTETFAELGDKIKGQLSHRAQAMKKLQLFFATHNVTHMR